MIATMLGAPKAGRIVVVLNPTDPAARLKELVHDAEPGLIVLDWENRLLAAVIAGEGCAVDQYERCAICGPTCNPGIRVSPDAVAFLCYTSGSTARPKAVMRTHRQEIRNARLHSSSWELVADDRIALLASLTGGLGTSISWCALLHGTALYPFATMDKGFIGLADALTGHRITIFASTASFFRAFARSLDEGASFPQIRVVRLSSEPVTAEDFKAFQAHFSETSKLVQTFGSSETGNIAQLRLRQADKVCEGRLPIGRPAEGIEVELLDERGGKVVPGETGEIVVRGRSLCAGYWRNPTATVAQFSEAPAGSGLRVFYSGDLARMNPDGLLEFVGRKDTRVKIRGYRVELLEVEHALLRLPGMERVFLDTCPGPNNELQLVAFVVSRQPSSAGILRRALRAVLPGHMVPTAFVFIEGFPLTPHGKIDREKLHQTNLPVYDQKKTEPPRTETESLLAAIWAEVLEVPSIGQQDDFFVLGGDSLSAAVVSARVRAALGIELNLGVFAESSTLAALARVIDEIRQAGIAAAAARLIRVPRETPLPLSFFQERIWDFSQTPEGSAGYTVAWSHRILGPLDAGLLGECMSYIAKRHEILRTTFAVVDGRPAQVIHPPAPVPLPLLDLAGTADAEAQATLVFKKEAARIFDLTQAPLMRFSLVRIREDEHWLLRINHHIISDGWSWKVYFRELASLYEAKLRGDDPPLPEFEPLQYGDYAAWQRKELHRNGPAYRESVAWWQGLLADAPHAIELPFKRSSRLPGLDPAVGIIRWGLDRQISERLGELACKERATYYMVRLAAFVALLAAETGAPDVVLGTHVTNRTRVVLQNMFGYFANLAALRFYCEPKRTFRDWLWVVRDRVVETEAHCEIPYEALRRELQGQGVTLPEIRVIFSVSHHRVAVRFANLELTRLDERMENMPWGFSMNFDEHNEKHGCWTTFDAGMYDPVGVREWIGRFDKLLDAVSRHPDFSLDALLAMSAQDAQGQG